MKKLISSTISVMTSMAMLACGCFSTAFAEGKATEDNTDIIENETYLGDIDIFGRYQLSDYPETKSNYSEGAYNYGDMLDANNLAVYNAVKKLTQPTDQGFTVKLPEPVSVSLSSSPYSRNGFKDEDAEKLQNAFIENCKPGLDCAFFDMPELYWVEPSNWAIAIGKDTGFTSNFPRSGYTAIIYNITIYPAYLSCFNSIDEAVEYGKMLEEAIERVDISGKTRYEKLKSIHDYIAKFTYYDTEAKFSSSALGALVEPGVVCEGYSEAFKLICDRLDIPCVCVFGNLDEEENSAHMWNYVQMEDGNWYGMDVTWDDVDGKNGREVKYDYFLKGSKRFFTNHTPESIYTITSMIYPEISESDYIPTSPPVTTTSTTTTTTTTTTSTTTTTTSKPTTTTTTSTTTTTTSKPTTTTTTSTTTTTTSKPTTTTTTSTTTTTTSKPTTTTTTSTTTTTTSKPTTTSTSSQTTTTTTTTVIPQKLIGDINRDGEVNVADLVYLQSSLLGKVRLRTRCDCNEDGVADVFDLIFLRKLLINH